MKIFCGTDIIEIERIKDAILDGSDSFLKKVFTQFEIEHCETKKISKFQHYAARFSAKEALVKAFGTGLTGGISLTEIEVRNQDNGKPYIQLYGKAKEKYQELKLLSLDLSISHCQSYAVAYIVAVSN